MAFIVQSHTNSMSKQHVFNGTTTNATETKIGAMDVSSDTAVAFDITIMTHQASSAGFGCWNIPGMAKNVSGTTSDVGDVYEVIVHTDHDDWVVDARANNTDDTLDIFVQGTASTTLHWTAYLNAVMQVI